MEVLLQKHLHQVDADEAILLLDSAANKGLDLFEVQIRQQRFGPNAIPSRSGHGPLITCLLQFHQPLFYILLIAGGITAALNEWIDAGVIFGVGRMARRRAIIRKLPAVETLGSTTTICSDKTGTLTVNQMTVRELYAAGQRYEATGSGYEPEGEFKPNADGGDLSRNAAARECLQAGLLCNDSTLVQKNGHWEVHGDPTEGALITAARKFGLDDKQSQQEFPRLDSVPFESQHQYMATLHDSGSRTLRLVYVKGAVEVVLPRCQSTLDSSGQSVGIDTAAIHADLEEMASRGLRVLAFARGEISAESDGIDHGDIENLTFLGLQGMIDPPRPEAVQAVQACQSAGVRSRKDWTA